MALVIRFQGLLRDGTVLDQSDLARLAHITQPRMTQILNLNHLAPDIQEDLLFLPPVEGRDPINERMLRPLTAMLDWDRQRAAWREIHVKRGKAFGPSLTFAGPRATFEGRSGRPSRAPQAWKQRARHVSKKASDDDRRANPSYCRMSEAMVVS